ncbi:MAG: dipicolinate synthase subunit B [Christensenellales bacterium]|jgi:dipicolinate synthase subunit B
MNKNIGFAITGSFCTFRQIFSPIRTLIAEGYNIIPIFSYSVTDTDTRFYLAKEFKREIIELTGKEPITTIVDAEPIGPKSLLDVLVVAPCTGNTLAKINHAITDTPVTMAVKAHLRNDKPVVIAISTNDGLSANAKNIGELLIRKNIYFVPYTQDDCVKKTRSLVADFTLIPETIFGALNGEQIQPILIGAGKN